MYKKKIYTVDELIQNSSFIRWVIKPDSQNCKYWHTYIHNNPSQQETVCEAKEFIESLQSIEPNVDHEIIQTMWSNIEQKRSKVKPKRVLIYKLMAAASVLLLIGFYSIRYINNHPAVDMQRLASIDTDQVQVILADGTITSIAGNKSEISQTNDGALLANNDTIRMDTKVAKKKEAMNQLVVPYGKRTDLFLSDGSHIFLNSGSVLLFPSHFNGSTRDIYLSGEAYCEVKSDKKHPFIVHTPDISVKVTGTAFNIQAYAEERITQTVLVHGAVTLTKGEGLLKEKVELEPGQIVSVIKETGRYTTSRVETEQYTSWVNGYLIFQNRSVDYILRSLERYYDTDIKFESDLQELSFSGKLDLRDNIEDVLNIIAFASSLEVEVDEISKEYNLSK